MSQKASKRKTPIKDSTVKAPNDPVLSDIGSRQVAQVFLASLSVYTFASHDKRVSDVFQITFSKLLRSPLYLNAGLYIQGILGATKKATIQLPPPSIFQVLLWFH